MSRIAIVDTAIDSVFINNKKVEYIDLCNSLNNFGGKAGHGTLCAMVLDHCTNDYELINIQIFKDNRQRIFGEVDVLVKAMKICCERNVDIVSLSSASSILSDTNKVYEVAKELCHNAIVVSAIDNRQYVSIPASYPFVVGVQNDNQSVLKLGEIRRDLNNSLGANVYANCDFPFLKEHGCVPSNSFAVPVVSAFVNDMLNQKSTASDIFTLLSDLKQYPNSEQRNMRQNVDEVPVIYVTASNTECRMLMDVFYDEFEVQTSTLSLMGGEYDVRIKLVFDIEQIAQELEFMEQHYKTDLIFIAGERKCLEKVQKSVEVDIAMLQQDDGCVLIEYEGIRERVPSVNAVARLHEILTVTNEYP